MLTFLEEPFVVSGELVLVGVRILDLLSKGFLLLGRESLGSHCVGESEELTLPGQTFHKVN